MSKITMHTLVYPHLTDKGNFSDQWIYAKSLQSCLSLYDPMDCSLPGSFVHGILQARILEWVAMSFSRQSSKPRDQPHISYVYLSTFIGR